MEKVYKGYCINYFIIIFAYRNKDKSKTLKNTNIMETQNTDIQKTNFSMSFPLGIFRAPTEWNLPHAITKKITETSSEVQLSYDGTMREYLQELFSWCFNKSRVAKLTESCNLFSMIDFFFQVVYRNTKVLSIDDSEVASIHREIAKLWGINDRKDYLTSPFCMDHYQPKGLAYPSEMDISFFTIVDETEVLVTYY